MIGREERFDILEQKLAKRKIASHPIAEFKAAWNDTIKGSTVTFKVADNRGIASLQLLRNTTLDRGSAKLIQSWTQYDLKNLRAYSFDDAAPELKNEKAIYYWLDCVPSFESADHVLIGPQQAINNSDQNAPDAISQFDASHEAVSGGAVRVSVSFKPAVQDRYGSTKIYISGYQGIAAFVAIAQNVTSPFAFSLSQTGETVTLKAIAVSKNGVEASTGPTKSLTLGTTATVPAQIVGATASELATGIQVSFPGGAELNLTQYSIYRAARGAGFGAASSIGTVSPTSAGQYSFLDTSGLTGKFEWYVVAQNAAGNGAASNAITQDVKYTSASVPVGAPLNQTNNATLDSIDAGSSATIRIYGPGGVGNAYTRYAGYGTELRPAGSVTGQSYNTKYYVYWTGATFLTSTNLFVAITDSFELIGPVTTVASGGGGGTTGGGGNTGGGPGPRTS